MSQSRITGSNEFQLYVMFNTVNIIMRSNISVVLWYSEIFFYTQSS